MTQMESRSSSSILADRRYGKARSRLLIILLAGAIALIGSWLGWRSYHLYAARVALARADTAAAQRHLLWFSRAGPRIAEYYLLAARTARLLGQYSDALEHLQIYSRLDGGSSDVAVMEQALLSGHLGRLTAAEESFLLALARRAEPESLDAWKSLAYGYLQSHRLSPAMYSLNQWLEREPAARDALLRRAYIFERFERTEDALADLRKAHALDPDNDVSRLYLAAMLLDLNRHSEAEPHLESLLQRLPTEPEVLLGLARCRRCAGRLDEAQRLLDTLLSTLNEESVLAATRAVAFTERGVIALQQGKLEECERWLRQSLALAPYEYEPNYVLHQCLSQLGKKPQAEAFRMEAERIAADLKRLRDLTRQVVVTPLDADLQFEVGRIMLRVGRGEEGEQFLNRAIQIRPDHEAARRTLNDYRSGKRVSSASPKSP